ncbi:MAG: hypothetical protein WBN04_19285 [Paracoccaceae bacterium]
MLNEDLEYLYEDEFEDEDFSEGFDAFGDEEDYEMFLDGEDFDGFDYEGDEFWGGLKKIGQKIGGAAKKVAGKLGKVAKAHAGKIGTVIGGAVGGPAGAAIGGRIGGIVQNLEDENDFDSEDEMEAQLPVAPLDESLAEAMASAASKSSPSDAAALGGAITITIMSKTPLAVKSVAPALASASGRIARSMATSPASRQLMKALPSIVKQTAGTLNRKAQKGKPISKGTAARVMTKHAKRTLGSQARLAQALAGNAAKRRRLDTAAIGRAERFY